MKKTSLVMGFILATLTSAHAYVQMHKGHGETLYDIAVDGIQFKAQQIQGVTYQVPQLKGVDGYTGIRYKEWQQEVPVIRLVVDAKSPEDIQIIARNYRTKSAHAIRGMIRPSLPGLAKIRSSRYAHLPDTKNKASINFSATPYSIERIGSVRGVGRYMVTLNPIDLNSLTNSLQIARSFQVNVREPVVMDQNVLNQGMVFIIGDKFKDSPSLAQYMALKNSLGLDIHAITVAQGMTPEDIRIQLQQLNSSVPNLKYALIIGDLEDVPAKESDIIYGVTDHYYAAIDTLDYNSDIATPDLQVGRVSVTDEEQLAIVLDKYTRYINGTYANRAAVNNISFLATDDRWELAEATHNYAINTYTAAKGYTGNFPAAGQLGGDTIYAVTHNAGNAELMRALQEGRSIFNYSGHGLTTGWDAPHMVQADVRAITSDALPFVISNACITADFREPEAFAETWQRHGMGAIVFWGSMDSTYWDEDDILEKRMYDGIFTQGKIKFGEITEYALTEMWKHYGGQGFADYYMETYHIFGDPSIELRLR